MEALDRLASKSYRRLIHEKLTRDTAVKVMNSLNMYVVTDEPYWLSNRGYNLRDIGTLVKYTGPHRSVYIILEPVFDTMSRKSLYTLRRYFKRYTDSKLYVIRYEYNKKVKSKTIVKCLYGITKEYETEINSKIYTLK